MHSRRSRLSTGESLRPYVERMREILTEPPVKGMPSDPTQLLGHMYIGGQSHAENLKVLRGCGITHVLNCAGYKGPRPFPNASPYEGLGIDYLEFQAEDLDTYDITQHFGEAFSYLDSVKRKRGTALVHCALGINRSAAVCVGYLMHHDDLMLLQAVKVIKKKRKVALTNTGFRMQLAQYAKRTGHLDKHVETESMRIEREQEEDALYWRDKLRRNREVMETFESPESSRRWDLDSDQMPSLASRLAVPSTSGTSALYSTDVLTPCREYDFYLQEEPISKYSLGLSSREDGTSRYSSGLSSREDGLSRYSSREDGTSRYSSREDGTSRYSSREDSTSRYSSKEDSTRGHTSEDRLSSLFSKVLGTNYGRHRDDKYF